MTRTIFFLAVGVCLFSLAGVTQGEINSFGVIGDSLSDEYEFADQANHCAGRNWLEQLVVSRNLDFGTYTTTSRSEPRNEGYEYNWARAGDTTGNLLSHGQHTGLAGQITNGDVDLAVCWIGENDFTRLDNINAICGAPDDSVWQGKVATAVTNLGTTVNTVLASDPNINLVLVTIPEIELNPCIRSMLPSPALRQRLSNAIASYNNQLINTIAAGNSRIVVADVYQLSLDILDLYKNNEDLVVGGYTVDLNAVGDTPECIILNDNIHPGTIAQGLMANVIIEAMNECGADIDPFTENEILHNAGVAPEPATCTLLAFGGLLCLRRRKNAGN